MPETILLLTATVRPQNMPNLALTDPAERLRQYIAAATFWAGQPGIDRIIFGDNSGFDLSEIVSAAEKGGAKGRFQTISFDAPPFDPKYGKGFGEMLILEKAVETCNEDSTIVKVTGRLAVANFADLLPGFQRNRRVTADLLNGLRRADARLFSAKPWVLKERLVPLKDQLDESQKVWMEHLLARAIHRELAEGGTWGPLEAWPDYRGYSGSAGTRLTEPIIKRAVLKLRHKVKNACYGELP